MKKLTPKKRCAWAKGSPLDIEYHDCEWGKPVYNDNLLFEFLTLEGAQAGLSWSTILKKRANYQAAFVGFDPVKVARFNKSKVEKLLKNAGIVRHRQKIESTINNAKAVLAIKKDFASFSDYIWQFVDGQPIQNKWRSLSEFPAKTIESGKMSKDMLKRGFRFVGPTTCYAFMQAVGLVNDHEISCFRHKELSRIKLGKK